MILVDTSQTCFRSGFCRLDLVKHRDQPIKVLIANVPLAAGWVGEYFEFYPFRRRSKESATFRQCHQFIHQKHPVNMARLFQWGIGDQFEMFSENLWIARDHKCDEKPHRLPRGPGEVNQNCPHHHHQHPHHRHIINPRFECTVDMRCLVSYIQWFHTTPDNGGYKYWRTKIQNLQEHPSFQDNRS